MLLYAQTDNGTQPDCCYQMSGNMINVKTLNLNCDFEDIRRQLDSIITDYLNCRIRKYPQFRRIVGKCKECNRENCQDSHGNVVVYAHLLRF